MSIAHMAPRSELGAIIELCASLTCPSTLPLIYVQMWMVRCYSGETYSNGGRRNVMTCKIHPLDSIRLTLNCEAGTLSLEVNGVDQGVVFSNVPRDVHPAVCFYGVTKSVRLVELKRIDGDSDSDMSDGDEDSDSCEVSEQPLHQVDEAAGSEEQAAQHLMNSPVPERSRDGTLAGPSPSCGESVMTGAGSRKANEVLHSRRHRKRAARGEDDAVAEAIRATTASSQSTGLLAGLSNFAQWYVPRNREPSREGQDASEEQAALAPTKGGTPLWIPGRQGNAEVTSTELRRGEM